jgi:DNA repair protein RecO (recombination protein O)
MDWSDSGIVVGLRKHGEHSIIAEVMTRHHGRHLGLVRSGRSRRMQAVLQPGNEVEAVWRARLEEQLGTFVIEATTMHAAAAFADARCLYGIGFLCALLRLFAERDPHPAVFETATLVLRHVDDGDLAPALLARLELAVLGELGFGLDLTRCAASGASTDLAYVSPKSGRAVSRIAGEPWKEKLLPLPDFLKDGVRDSPPTPLDVSDAFKTTGYFLGRDVLAPRGLEPIESRRAFLTLLEKTLAMGAKTSES